MAEDLQQESSNENKAGCLGIGISFLFPIVGIILYATKKKTVINANNYLCAAIIAIVIGMIIRMAGA